MRARGQQALDLDRQQNAPLDDEQEDAGNHESAVKYFRERDTFR